jgi:NhaP-type Na+/H+ or K+/H+ antiporter
MDENYGCGLISAYASRDVDVEKFVATIALIGIVIVVASLLSGIIERIGIPLVGAFLLLGAALGPFGFHLADIQLQSPELRVLATLGLALVLFSDAVTVDIREVRERRKLVWTVVGPGTLLPALIIALAAYWLLGIPKAGAAILGAALASTDPVLLKSVLRVPTLPATARVALRLESGTNDAVLLPIIVLGTLALRPGGTPITGQEIGRGIVGLFVLGPALGAMVGWAGITMLATVRSRIGVRRDYESLYALGLGFGAYAAAEAVGGSGFLAAFAAGLAIAALDVELCDCFLEYGEATAEMLLLLTFVAFGTSLIWTGFSVADWRTLMFAVIALGARTVVLYPVLTQIGVRGRDRKLIALFGPRGLSTLLLTLLPVFAGVAGAERLFTIACLVVLLSLVVHGSVIGFYLRGSSPRGLSALGSGPSASSQYPAESGEPRAESREPRDKITIADVHALQQKGEPIVFVDSRAPKSYNADDRQIAGSVRIPPDDPVRAATEQGLAQHATLVVYCA